MPLDFFIGPRRLAHSGDSWLMVRDRRVQLHLVRHCRARRYVLRLRPDGSARVTIPRGGSTVEARQFAGKHVAWLERQLLRQAARPPAPRQWPPGTNIFFRGESVRLELVSDGPTKQVRFAQEVVGVHAEETDLRPAVERHLWRLAARELPARVSELAAQHRLSVRRVVIRNQRWRWGSCSRRGTISLNWRLVQAPTFVRDYLVLHELVHLREMNHSPRFWREVAKLCPNFSEAERWLKEHVDLLR